MVSGPGWPIGLVQSTTPYHLDGEGFHDHTNPLWREQYHYTGERRGAYFDGDTASTTNNAFSSQEAAEVIKDDTASDFLLRRGDALRRIELRRGGGSVPYANIGQNVRDGVTGSVQSHHPLQDTRCQKGRFSLSFRPRRGRLDVDLFDTTVSTYLRDTRHNRIGQNEQYKPAISPLSSSAMSDSNNMTTTSAKSYLVANEVGKNETSSSSLFAQVMKTQKRMRGQMSALVPIDRIAPSPLDDQQSSQSIQLALSIDPFSFAVLIRNLIFTTGGIFAAFTGTLKLLAPMILAKRILTTLGYIFYDHYNGRYIRTQYTRRMRHLQEYEVIASSRALGRCLVQTLAMGSVGKFVLFAMNWAAPCLLQPTWLCDWWYGVVWMSFVYMAGLGFGFLIGRTSPVSPTLGANTTVSSSNPLSIRPTQFTSTTSTRQKRRDSKLSPLSKFAQIPWKLLQKMKDPEEWINNMFRIASYKNNYPIQVSPQRAKVKLDTLLFPSTWMPLRIWTCLIIIRAVRRTLDASSYSGMESSAPPFLVNRDQIRIMRSFILQETLHCEWYRIFVKERRVALGAVVSFVALLSLLGIIHTVAVVDGVAAVALIPTLIASLVSGWMNVVLYYDHYLPSSHSSSSSTSRHRR
jgi:tryptophan-rich sensory protein